MQLTALPQTFRLKLKHFGLKGEGRERGREREREIKEKGGMKWKGGGEEYRTSAFSTELLATPSKLYWSPFGPQFTKKLAPPMRWGGHAYAAATAK